jgi:hypothetical protein
MATGNWLLAVGYRSLANPEFPIPNPPLLAVGFRITVPRIVAGDRNRKRGSAIAGISRRGSGRFVWGRES